jgi:hypothetical protein
MTALIHADPFCWHSAPNSYPNNLSWSCFRRASRCCLPMEGAGAGAGPLGALGSTVNRSESKRSYSSTSLGWACGLLFRIAFFSSGFKGCIRYTSPTNFSTQSVQKKLPRYTIVLAMFRDVVGRSPVVVHDRRKIRVD